MHFVIVSWPISWDMVWGFIKIAGGGLLIVILIIILLCLIVFSRLLTADNGKNNNFVPGTPQPRFRYPFL